MNKFCPSCGAPIASDAPTCQYCGASLTQNAQPAQQQPTYPNQGGYPPYQQAPYQQTPYQDPYQPGVPAPKDKASIGLIIVSLLIPIVGVILGIVNWKKTPNAAKTYLIVGIVAWVINFIIVAASGGMM